MGRRLVEVQQKVTITLDGEAVAAEQGEPAALSLLAAGRMALARSPKFHRPRGPACFRSACDGCLARVDDVPNVMTCQVAAREGLKIETQNTLGSRKIDLLRVTDWFFPEGLNHHELFAGIPGVQNVMQAFARRVAGLGKLPKEPVKPRTARRRSVDVLVVGGGAAGISIACSLSERGRSVEMVDDAITPNGSLSALIGEDASRFDPLLQNLERAKAAGSVVVRPKTVVGAIYGDDVLVVSAEGTEVVTARAVVLAPGAHDGQLAFEGNDLPGVMSARAAGWLFNRGVLPGEQMAIVTVRGGGPFGKSLARGLEARGLGNAFTAIDGEPLEVRGSSEPKSIKVRAKGDEYEFDADAVIIDAPRSPAYELSAQAGGKLRHVPDGFIVDAPSGKIRERFYVTGEAAGIRLDLAAIAEHAALVGKTVA